MHTQPPPTQREWRRPLFNSGGKEAKAAVRCMHLHTENPIIHDQKLVDENLEPVFLRRQR